MTDWNPGAPAFVGLEWPATRLRWVQLSRVIAAAAIVEVTDAQALDAVWAYVRVDVPPLTGNALVQAQIYDADDPFGPQLMLTDPTIVPSPTAGSAKWVRMPRFVPASFTPSVGQRLLIICRGGTPNATYRLSWATLDCSTVVGAETVRLPGHKAVEVPLGSLGQPDESYDEDQTDNGARALALGVTPTTITADAQPYVEPVMLPAHGDNPPSAVPEQRLVAPATATYGSIRILARNDVVHSQALLVKVLDLPGTTELASGVFDTSDLPNVPDQRWYRLRATFAAPLALTLSDVVRVQISTASPPSAPWQIGDLLTHADLGGITALNEATYGGIAEVGPTNADDLPLVLEELVPGPDSVTALTEMHDTSRGLVNCVVDSAEVAVVTWEEPTGLDPDTIHSYDVERKDDGEWRAVAQIIRGAVVIVPPNGPRSFVDWEALRNVAVRYRVRVRTIDGTLSGWTESSNVVVTSGDADVFLVSNWRPDLSWVGHDEPGYTWTPVDSERLTTRMLHGRNRQIAFRELANRGDRFDRSLIVAFADPNMPRTPLPWLFGAPDPHTPPGRGAFDSLLAIAHARDVPYVAFLDGRGRRWYTAPAVFGVHEGEPAQQYLADVQFVEVTDTPAPVGLTHLPALPGGGGEGWGFSDWDLDVWSAG